MKIGTLTKLRATAIKKSILKALEKETKMLSEFKDRLRTYEAQIYVGKTDANNEEILSCMGAQIERKNKRVTELSRNLNLIELTIKFKCANPKAKIPTEMYNGECKICKTQIPHKQQVVRCAPRLCVPCENKHSSRKL